MYPNRLFLSAALMLASGCAADSGALPSPAAAASAAASSPGLMMVVEATVGGSQLAPTPDSAYYFVLATSGDGPRITGAAPRTHPYPDPRSYLPFVRDESHVLDRQPIAVPGSSWSHYWALTHEAGQPTVFMGRRNADGSVEERARQLTRGTEWDLVAGSTWKLTVPVPSLAAGTPLGGGWTANLATARRTAPGDVIDRWGQTANETIRLAPRLGQQAFYDTNPGPTFPAAVPPGADAASLDWRTLTVRLVDVGAP